MSEPVEDFGERLRACRWGIVLALLAILFGFAMGGVFGAAEDSLKADLSARAAAVRDTVYGGDDAKIESVLTKSWSYYKRAHMHAGGIGAAALAAILLLAALRRPPPRVRAGVAAAVGLGSVGYPLFWMLAARAAPSLGGTDAAKESLAWLAVPSAGLLLLGVVAVIALAAIDLFASRPAR